MIKFYLQQIDNQHEIKCNTNSTITEVAGAFDLGTMELEWNECKYAIFPNTPFFIKETETNEVWNFIIAEDNVEVVKKINTVKYLHRLTLSQSIHKLSNVPVRNSVFSQPFNSIRKIKKSTFFCGGANYTRGATGQLDHLVKTIYFNHTANQDTFLANNYGYDFTNLRVSSIRFSFDLQLNTYQHATYSDGQNGWALTTIYQVLRSTDYLESLLVRFINVDNPSDYISINVTNFDDEVELTQAQREFLQGKKIIVKLIQGTFADNLVNYLPNSIENSYYDLMPVIAGFITTNLTVEIYKYTLWDVLDILNKQCIKEYNGSHLDNYYVMPTKTIGQGLELDSVVAPELSFTQCDLYEAIAQTLNYIDAFPILKENNVLGFQYLNNLSTEEIENLQISDVKTTLNETNFTNKLATYYQNGKKSSPIIYPSKSLFVRPANLTYGVLNKNDLYWFVSKPIDYIESLNVLLTNSVVSLPDLVFYDDFTGAGANKEIMITEFNISNSSLRAYIDLSHVIYDSDVYNYLPVGLASDIANPHPYNSLYYSRGDNKIFLGIIGKIVGSSNPDDDVLFYALTRAATFNYGYGNGVLYSPRQDGVGIAYDMNNRQNYCFQCSYYPILDGKISQESTNNKVEKETIVAQGNSNAELNKLGNNIQGLIAKLGNEEKSITLPITNFKSKIKLGTKFVDELGNNWFANRIQTTFTTDEEKVIVNVVFTKDYNAMAQFTRLNQEKRFYEISQRLNNTGYENLNEFLYFTQNQSINTESLATHIAIDDYGLQSILKKTLNDDYDYVLATREDTFNFVALYTDSANTYITPVVYGCGNQICFEMSFEEPLLARRRLYDGETKSWLYAGENGEAETISLVAKFPTKNYMDNPYLFPEVETSVFVGSPFFRIDNYKYYKKENETLYVNYSLNFLPYWTKTTDALGNPHYIYEDIFFGNEFINENGIIPNNKYDGKKIRKMYLYLSNDLYSIIDNKVLDGSILLGNVDVRVDVSGSYSQGIGTASHGTLRVYYNGNYVNVSQYKSWCIADQDKNIYIAVNRNKNASDYAELQFFTSRNRKV